MFDPKGKDWNATREEREDDWQYMSGNYMCLEAGFDCPGHHTPNGRCTMTMVETSVETRNQVTNTDTAKQEVDEAEQGEQPQ